MSDTETEKAFVRACTKRVVTIPAAYLNQVQPDAKQMGVNDAAHQMIALEILLGAVAGAMSGTGGVDKTLEILRRMTASIAMYEANRPDSDKVAH